MTELGLLLHQELLPPGTGTLIPAFRSVLPQVIHQVGGWGAGGGQPMQMRAHLEMRVFRCRANMAHLRQSRPDSGSNFQRKVLETDTTRAPR